MRIGILTLPLHTNYGGILQAYALQTILKRMGHEVVVIDTYKKLHLPVWKWPLSIPKRLISKYLLGKKNIVLAEYKYNKTLSIINQHTQNFIRNNISRKIIKNLSEIKSSDFDIIVVGSDQVWRPCYFKNMFHTTISHSFLDFAKNWNIKRIAYAASFGTEKWEFTKEETEQCKKLALLFEAISVREDSGIQLCKSKLNVEAQHVLDPTMLLDVNEYISLIKKANTPISKGDLLCYILDENEEKKQIIEKIARQKSLSPFIVNASVYKSNNEISKCIQPPVENWLRGFYDAKFIITDSFHACVFSILFKKHFLVIGNKERGMSRFCSLLKMFELDERLISDINDISKIENTINWNKVDEIYSLKKNISLAFLKQHINN